MSAPCDRRGEEVERALGERLLELAQAGDSGPEYRAAVESVYELVLTHVSSVFRAWTNLPVGVMDAGDVAHEILLRLQTSPPTKNPGLNARVTLLSWIRKTTGNYLTDVFRRTSSRTIALGPEDLVRLRTWESSGTHALRRR